MPVTNNGRTEEKCRGWRWDEPRLREEEKGAGSNTGSVQDVWREPGCFGMGSLLGKVIQTFDETEQRSDRDTVQCEQLIFPTIQTRLVYLSSSRVFFYGVYDSEIGDRIVGSV